MNDNIEKLCAELLHYDDMIFGWRETVERAAEAIVLECCEVADTLHLYLPPMTAKKLIVRHFGVEE